MAPSRAVDGHPHPVEGEPRQAGRPHAHRRLRCDGQALGAALDQDQHGFVVEQRTHHEQHRVGAPRHEGLDPVEHQVVAVAARGGRRPQHVEEHARLHQGQGGGGHVVAGELRQVGLLLLVAAPQPERRRDRARGQGGHGEAEVPVRERLGDQGAGHGRALLGDATEGLGDPEDRQPDLHRGLQHRLGGRAGVVRLGRGGAHHLGGEPGDHVDEHAARPRSGSGRRRRGPWPPAPARRGRREPPVW